MCYNFPKLTDRNKQRDKSKNIIFFPSTAVIKARLINRHKITHLHGKSGIRPNKFGLSVVDVAHDFAERTVVGLDRLRSKFFAHAVSMRHDVDDIQVFPVNHAVPQIVSFHPVGGRELVRFNVQQIGVL